MRYLLDNPSRRDVALVFLIVGLFFCIGLGARPYLTPSEARYIEIPQQMLTTGDWLTPRINGVPYFEKPPLFYWMQAGAMQLFGNGEFAGRLCTALLTTLTCVITFAAARMLYGRLAGFLATAVLATSLLGYGMSRIAVLDVPVTFFLTACIACFLAAQQSEEPHHKNDLYMLMYAASALALMSKGLIGIVIPSMIISGWIVATGKWNTLKEARLFTGLVIVLAIAAPWHLLMAKAHPDFLNFYFIHEHFTRYLTDEHKRTAPWWFFIAVTALGFLPWTGVFATTCKTLLRRDPATVLLTLWILLPLIFFSMSHSKLTSYIFPIFPPIAIMLGQTLAQMWDKEIPAESLKWNIAFVIVIFVGLLTSYHFLPEMPGKTGRKLEVLEQVSFMGFLPLLIALLGLTYILLRQRSPRTLIKSLIIFGAVTGLTLNYAWTSFDQSSIKPLATQLAPKLREGDAVVAFKSYWQDLPVYLNRDIIVAGWTGELGFGVEHYPETTHWMISENEFWQRCAKSKNAVYVFINEQTLSGFTMPRGCQLQPIGFYGKSILLEKR